MKMENLFVTWQQRSAPASMPISVSARTTSPGTLPRLLLILTTPCLPGWGAGDPEAVIPSGALLRHSPALPPRCLAAWPSRALGTP